MNMLYASEALLKEREEVAKQREKVLLKRAEVRTKVEELKQAVIILQQDNEIEEKKFIEKKKRMEKKEQAPKQMSFLCSTRFSSNASSRASGFKMVAETSSLREVVVDRAAGMSTGPVFIRARESTSADSNVIHARDNTFQNSKGKFVNQIHQANQSGYEFIYRNLKMAYIRLRHDIQEFHSFKTDIAHLTRTGGEQARVLCEKCQEDYIFDTTEKGFDWFISHWLKCEGMCLKNVTL